MSNRKDFIRNSLLIFCAAILPRVLQPSVPEIAEEMVEVPVEFVINPFIVNGTEFIQKKSYSFGMILTVKKNEETRVKQYLESLSEKS